VGRRRRIIALVGIDGSGKTTLATDLSQWLTAQGTQAEYFLNPGGRVAIDRFARRLGRADGRELLGRRLFAAVEASIRWLAIAKGLLLSWLTGRMAVMDRYSYCEYATLRARGEPGERWARRFYRVFPEPDATFIALVPPQVAHQRIADRGYDWESVEYLSALDNAYRGLPEFPGFEPIDADAPLEEVKRRLRAAVGRAAAAP
jgi:dTMP kinase